MKRILPIFLLLIFDFCLAQNNSYHDIIEPRLAFSTEKRASSYAGEMIVLEKDTLFAHYDHDVDLSHLDWLIENEKFNKFYKRVVFGYSGEHRGLFQWSVPIKIYMDKGFPKSIAEKLEIFFSKIKGIKNLNISFVKEIKDANYFIKLTEAEVNAYGEDYKFYSEADRINSIYTGGVYKLNVDKNNKFYSGTLYLNNKRLENKKRALNQLKQTLFSSLGSFRLTYPSKKQNSLLYINYLPQESISEIDLKLLRVHYSFLYKQPVNGKDFNRLMKLRKDKI